MKTAKAPDLTPTVRDEHFALDAVSMNDWHPAGAHVSHFFNALSPFFPDGEKFFIRSVRYFADRASSPQQAKEIQAFIGQEAMHGREHRAYNAALQRAGFPAEAVEKFVQRDLRWVERRFSPEYKLAMTAALEHLTAILASLLLRDESILDGAQPEMAQLWRWHAIEETEHKAVAFDLYQQVAPGRRGYIRRCLALMQCSPLFLMEIFAVHWLFLKHSGQLWSLRGWARAWSFLWGRPGVLRRTVPAWFSYFRPGFHPWQDENRHHVDAWQRHDSTHEAVQQS